MQRNQKICKIIEELSLYLMDMGIYNLNIDIKQDDDKDVLTFSFNECNDEVKDFILSKIKGERDIEIEEYGWELMGEGASDDDLGIINALVDEINYDDNDNKTIIRMIRYE